MSRLIEDLTGWTLFSWAAAVCWERLSNCHRRQAKLSDEDKRQSGQAAGAKRVLAERRLLDCQYQDPIRQSRKGHSKGKR